MRTGLLALLLVLFSAVPGSAEWQIKPFLGLSFGSSTTFAINQEEIDDPKVFFGVGTMWLGEFLGLEADFSLAPGFSGDPGLVVGSRLTTLTGNIVIALPRRLAQYSLRPYFVGGAGLVHARQEDIGEVLQVSSTLATLDIGGGVTGFLSDRIGLNWDVRRFRSIGGSDQTGISFGRERVSFWRASMALALRY